MITEKNITICGHGGGTPSTKNMEAYFSARYNLIASNKKHKGIIAVKRPKNITKEQRQKFVEAYTLILGRNAYSQTYRQYVFTPKSGKYYSDCSSSYCAALARAGLSMPLHNTAGIYHSSQFEDVPVKIKNGHILNPEILEIGDALLFVGDDPSRPLQIGHIEAVFKIDKPKTPEKTPKEEKKDEEVKTSKVSYYKKYTGKSESIVDALASVGEKDTSLAHRKKIALASGLKSYSGTAKQNIQLLSLLKSGKLVKA